MRKKVLSILFIVIFLSACGETREVFTPDSEKLNIYVSFYPMEYLAREIGQEYINLKTIIPQGIEPHDYEPSINVMKNFENTDILIYNGLGLEPWIDDLIEATEIENVEIINSSDYVEVLELKEDPGEHDGHSHGSTDPHIWLNPQNMINIGEEIKNTFIRLDKNNSDIYEKNFTVLKNNLEDLDMEYTNKLKNKKEKDILVSHEAFSYMAEKYDFNQISVSGISPEEEPSPRNIANLIDITREKNIDYIFLETLSNSKAVDIISKEANLEILILNPLEGLTEENIKNSDDYISIMYENLKELEKALVK